LGQKIIVYRALQFCNEYRENKEFITYLKRAIEKAEKRIGKSDWTVKNIRRDFADAEKVGENSRRPEKF
jgi:hypothetical protein